ncbi:MAG: cation transporter [Wenzhouxiangella sp.]|nr:MAG: cation transporter [Wenzhouxiangella sp.]
MREAFFLTCWLVLLWLAISGVYKPVILLLGIASVMLVLWLSLRMKVVGEEHAPAIFGWRLPVFWVWTLVEIVRSNLHVARLTFSPEKISPRIVTTDVPFRTSVAKVVYGNTCTLTPGTVTLMLTRDKLVAHALDQTSSETLTSGRLARKVLWLEGSPEPEK